MRQVNDVSERQNEEISRFRRILPQFIATIVKNLLIVDLGLIGAFPVILIASMTGNLNEHNRNEILSITPVQATWLGSIGNLFEPIGSMLSVFITDPIGRKRSMIFVNIPLVLGWLMLYQGDMIWKIFIGCALHGLGIGLMEGPLISYIAEICEPSTRGVLVSISFITTAFGMFLGLFLNTLMPWRSIAAVCLTLPIITAIAICFIPETPQWLLSKNRTLEAEKSLRWLRGWISSDSMAVAQELHDLQRHSERSKSCNTCIKRDRKCTHPLPTLSEKFVELKRKRALKPLLIIIFMFCVGQFSGLYSMRPFIVQIFKAYESPLPPDQSAAMLSLIESLTCCVFVGLIRFTGRRRLYLITAFGAFVCSGVISCYGFIYLPGGYISFDLTHGAYHMENAILRYIPTVFLILFSFFSCCGFITIPWILISEIFPMKSRGVASGVAVAVNYSLRFITKKTYYSMETTLSLPGVTLFYCIVCGTAFVVAYFILPETENISLEDIELHFSDNSKKITDRKIRKTNAKTSGKVAETSFGNVANNSYNGVDNHGLEINCEHF